MPLPTQFQACLSACTHQASHVCTTEVSCASCLKSFATPCWLKRHGRVHILVKTPQLLRRTSITSGTATPPMPTTHGPLQVCHTCLATTCRSHLDTAIAMTTCCHPQVCTLRLTPSLHTSPHSHLPHHPLPCPYLLLIRSHLPRVQHAWTCPRQQRCYGAHLTTVPHANPGPSARPQPIPAIIRLLRAGHRFVTLAHDADAPPHVFRARILAVPACTPRASIPVR